jgi:hypothetical protein
MRPAETIPGMGGEQMRMMEGVNSTVIYLIYCKNFWECHNVLCLQQKLKKNKGHQIFLIFGMWWWAERSYCISTEGDTSELSAQLGSSLSHKIPLLSLQAFPRDSQHHSCYLR